MKTSICEPGVEGTTAPQGSPEPLNRPGGTTLGGGWHLALASEQLEGEGHDADLRTPEEPHGELEKHRAYLVRKEQGI